jgi:hypothetical protein
VQYEGSLSHMHTVSDKKDATGVFERFFTDNFFTVIATEPYSMCNR